MSTPVGAVPKALRHEVGQVLRTHQVDRFEALWTTTVGPQGTEPCPEAVLSWAVHDEVHSVLRHMVRRPQVWVPRRDLRAMDPRYALAKKYLAAHEPGVWDHYLSALAPLGEVWNDVGRPLMEFLLESQPLSHLKPWLEWGLQIHGSPGVMRREPILIKALKCWRDAKAAEQLASVPVLRALLSQGALTHWQQWRANEREPRPNSSLFHEWILLLQDQEGRWSTARHRQVLDLMLNAGASPWVKVSPSSLRRYEGDWPEHEPISLDDLAMEQLRPRHSKLLQGVQAFLREAAANELSQVMSVTSAAVKTPRPRL